jgi:hypothetical protein
MLTRYEPAIKHYKDTPSYIIGMVETEGGKWVQADEALDRIAELNNRIDAMALEIADLDERLAEREKPKCTG